MKCLAAVAIWSSIAIAQPSFAEPSVFSLPNPRWGLSRGDDRYTSFSSAYLDRLVRRETSPIDRQQLALGLAAAITKPAIQLSEEMLAERLRALDEVPGLERQALRDGFRYVLRDGWSDEVFYVTVTPAGELVQLYLDVDGASEAGLDLQGLDVRRRDSQEWCCFFLGPQGGRCSFRYDGD